MAWDVRGKPDGGQNGPLAAYQRLFSAEHMPLRNAWLPLLKGAGVDIDRTGTISDLVT